MVELILTIEGRFFILLFIWIVLFGITEILIFSYYLIKKIVENWKDTGEERYD